MQYTLSEFIMSSDENSEPQEQESHSAEKTEKKPECYVVPDSVKPLVECCKDFEAGRIDESTFFADALVKTGEFMKFVKTKPKVESP
jgi:hypothetical protein